MTTFDNVRDFFYVKSRPDKYKASDAAYSVGGNGGITLSGFPSSYPNTDQQTAVAEIADACGIEAGKDKSVIMEAMKKCSGPAMRAWKRNDHDLDSVLDDISGGEYSG